jgi:hypothetical protein
MKRRRRARSRGVEPKASTEKLNMAADHFEGQFRPCVVEGEGFPRQLTVDEPYLETHQGVGGEVEELPG